MRAVGSIIIFFFFKDLRIQKQGKREGGEDWNIAIGMRVCGEMDPFEVFTFILICIWRTIIFSI